MTLESEPFIASTEDARNTLFARTLHLTTCSLYKTMFQTDLHLNSRPPYIKKNIKRAAKVDNLNEIMTRNIK